MAGGDGAQKGLRELGAEALASPKSHHQITALHKISPRALKPCAGWEGAAPPQHQGKAISLSLSLFFPRQGLM